MFLRVPGMAPVLVRYLEALNGRDLDAAAACVAPDILVRMEHDDEMPTPSTPVVGHAGIVEWLRRSLSGATVTIAPLQATSEGEVTTLTLAISVISPLTGISTMLQDVDYTVVDDRIAAIHARPFRRGTGRS